MPPKIYVRQHLWLSQRGRKLSTFLASGPENVGNATKEACRSKRTRRTRWTGRAGTTNARGGQGLLYAAWTRGDRVDATQAAREWRYQLGTAPKLYRGGGRQNDSYYSGPR